MNVIDSYLNFLTILQADPEERKTLKRIHEIGIQPVEKKDFDVEEYVNRFNKPIIEIAGPTPQGFKTIDVKKLASFFTSNLAKQEQKAENNPQTGTWKDYVASSGEVDFQADGQHLPLAAESVGAILISALLNDEQLNKNIINEANRVLVKQGILILEANLPHDVLYALEHGFEPVKWERKLSNFFEPYLNIVLRKK